jgi:hypothetical protein
VRASTLRFEADRGKICFCCCATVAIVGVNYPAPAVLSITYIEWPVSRKRVLPHLESMQPDSILDRVHDIEKLDRVARRNYGLGDNQSGTGSLSIKALTTGRTLIQIAQTSEQDPAIKSIS